MNTRRGREKIKNFRILLDNGCIFTILMRSPIKKLKTKEDYVIKLHTQTGNLTTNLKAKIYLTLSEFSATNIDMWECHLYDFTKGRYDMIFGRDILTVL